MFIHFATQRVASYFSKELLFMTPKSWKPFKCKPLLLFTVSSFHFLFRFLSNVDQNLLTSAAMNYKVWNAMPIWTMLVKFTLTSSTAPTLGVLALRNFQEYVRCKFNYI